MRSEAAQRILDRIPEVTRARIRRDADLLVALSNPLWVSHKIGDTYTMDNKPELWKIAYYPIFEHGKTKEQYIEPRALVEKPMENGIDFREMPLRYLRRENTHQ